MYISVKIIREIGSYGCSGCGGQYPFVYRITIETYKTIEYLLCSDCLQKLQDKIALAREKE